MANRDQKRRGGGGQSSAIGCLLWPISMPVCLRGGSRMLRRQRRSRAWGGTQAWHHLHSTATVFCVGEAEDGLMPVSDEPDDVDAVVWDTVDQKSGQITKDQTLTNSNTVYIYDNSVQFSNSLNLMNRNKTTSIKAIIITFIFFHYYHQFINNIILSQKSIIHKRQDIEKFEI